MIMLEGSLERHLPIPKEKVIQKMRPAGRLSGIPANDRERQVAKYEGVCHIEGRRFERRLALTFDDGPSGLTEILLDLLKEFGVRATFFWLGQHLKEFKVLARRAFAEGHAFGNHSFDHTDFTEISADEVLREQIKKTQMLYRNTLGIEPSLVRPPFGVVTDKLIEALKEMGMKVVFWSIDSGDFIEGKNSADRITNKVVSLLHEEAIILMHDGGSATINTIKALRMIVTYCKAQGYEFTTVHDLISPPAGLLQEFPILH